MTDTPDTSPEVLIVEDERSLAEIYEMWLADVCSVTAVHSGRKALEILDSEFDVVVLDRRMPGVSGDEILDHIRAECPETPVVVVSAVTPGPEAIGMRFDDYLVKPVDRDELREAIDRLVTRPSLEETPRKLTRLAAEKAAVEAEASSQRLEANEQFDRLCRRIETLRNEIETRHGGSDDFDLEALCRGFEKNETKRGQ